MSQKNTNNDAGTSAGPFGPRVRRSVGSRDSVDMKLSVTSVHVVTPQPFVSPAHPKQQQSRVLHRQVVRHPHKRTEQQVAELQPIERYYEPVQQTGKLRTALQSCFGLFA